MHMKEESELLNGLLIYLSLCMCEATKQNVNSFQSFFPNLFGIWDLESIAVIRGFQMQILWSQMKKKMECEQWPSSVWGKRAAESSSFLLVLTYSSSPSMNVSCLLLTFSGYLYGLSSLEMINPSILKIYSRFFFFLQQVDKHFL